ncbi:MAG: hypothetical protein JWR24_4518 [Actinoallomurus sp.]|nr:hypothetical protein [Actinoallomurus sp.]
MVREPGNTRPATAADTSPTAGASTGELVAQASRQISDLVGLELALARAELAEKGKDAGRGARLFGGAGVIAFYGGGAVVVAAVAGLAVVWPVWAAALVVGVVLLAVAGVLVLAGRKQFGRAGPPVPEKATASMKADVREIKDHLSERHHHE